MSVKRINLAYKIRQGKKIKYGGNGGVKRSKLFFFLLVLPIHFVSFFLIALFIYICVRALFFSNIMGNLKYNNFCFESSDILSKEKELENQINLTVFILSGTGDFSSDALLRLARFKRIRLHLQNYSHITNWILPYINEKQRYQGRCFHRRFSRILFLRHLFIWKTFPSTFKLRGRKNRSVETQNRPKNAWRLSWNPQY